MPRSQTKDERSVREVGLSREEMEPVTGIVVIGDVGVSLTESIREAVRKSGGRYEVIHESLRELPHDVPGHSDDADRARQRAATPRESPRMAASDRMPALIDAMMPTSVPTAPMVLQARRNTEARTSLMEEFGLLASAEIAELNQSKAENRAALASRWKGEGKIFSVKHDGRDWFPGFQFHPDGSPREAIAPTLSALGGARGWETALWFTASNGYLEGRRPVDLLEEDSAAVVEAAAHEAEEVFF